MRTLRPVSFDDFVSWYLVREHGKGNLHAVPLTLLERHVLMADKHYGKLWKGCASWSWLLVELDDLSDLANLLVLASDWTREERLVRDGTIRTLDNAVTHALNCGYFEQHTRKRARHHAHYSAFANSPPSTSELGRVVLRTLLECEKAEIGAADRGDISHYLHDGLGRLLPYLALVRQQRLQPVVVEAFLAAPSPHAA